MLDFTVVIPTYNSALRLPQVLEVLKLQIGIENLTGEILVVDNNSTDNTAEIVHKYQQNWLFPFPLKYFFAPRQGAAYARQLGVRQAEGELIGFLDDDNFPEPDWIYAAYLFAQSYPQAGAYGSLIRGEFESAPPEDFAQIAQFLAIRDHGQEALLFQPQHLRLPPSAGLVVRRKAWLESVPEECILTGPQKDLPRRGEDYEVLLYLHKKGWEIWYNPEMSITHYIPRQRLTRDYLLPLAEGIGLATCQLRMLLAKDWQKPFIWARTILGNLRRIIFHM
jgi:glycosyltransferase involved in cell wall biosynthesis